MRSKLLPIMVLLLLLVTCAWIVLYRMQPPRVDHFGISFLLGSLYGHCTLASGWLVFGPGGWRRLPLAFVWLLAIPCASSLNTMLYPGANSAWVSAAVWISGGIVMALVLMLSCPLRFWWRLRICKPVQATESATEHSHQFGIRELMILTTIVAVFIGGGRLILPYLLKWLATPDSAVFAILIVASVVVCIPLTFSMLAMRKPIVPTLVIFVFTVVLTYLELPLLLSLGLPRGGPDQLHFILINGFFLLPIAIVCVMLRLAGYQLSAINRA